ncbi:MAG: hypothetical protein HZC48_00620 [Nitrospirae bacterium]|nr:hypothetical protein [Nitrospirota bacterium]
MTKNQAYLLLSADTSPKGDTNEATTHEKTTASAAVTYAENVQKSAEGIVIQRTDEGPNGTPRGD